MGIKETQEQLHNMFQQIGYRIEASKKYYALRNDLIKNGTNYSNELFGVIDEIVTGTEQQQFIKVIPVGTILYRAREIDVVVQRKCFFLQHPLQIWQLYRRSL